MASAVDAEWGFGLGLGTRWTNGFIDTVGGSSCMTPQEPASGGPFWDKTSNLRESQMAKGKEDCVCCVQSQQLLCFGHYIKSA